MTEEVKSGISSVTPEQIQEAENIAAGLVAPAPQTDIEKLEAQISQLKADGSAIYDTAIQALEDERAQLISEAKKVEEEAQAVVTDVETTEKTFREKYGNEVLNSVEIVALAAIIWRLFFF